MSFSPAMFTQLFKVYWDFFVDWSLLERGVTPVLLRNQLMYHPIAWFVKIFIHITPL
jgi:hypothetical protein